ncbi:MAG: lipoprotein-releasing ABC transporter permease subunit [Acidobacteriota bacterium]
MRFELFVALRYLKARRKQAVVSVITLISVLGVAAGVAALVIALALNSGFQAEFQNRILGATSHVNVLDAEGGAIRGFREVEQRILEAPGVVSAAGAVFGQGLLAVPGRQEPVVIKGVEPGRLADALPRLVEGSLEGVEEPGEVPPLFIGKDLAFSLALSAGDYVRLMGLEGEISPLGRMPRVRTYRVAAIFESGLWDFDAHWVLLPLWAAQDFLGYAAEEVSTIEVRLEDIYAAPDYARRFRDLLGDEFATSTWIELNRPLFSALRLEKLAMFLAIGLITLVAALNIVSTLTLMVMEKSRDIAIVTAMGGTRSVFTKIFMLQGLIIGAVGVVIGDLLGVAACWYLDTYRVISLNPEVYSIPYVPFHWTPGDVVLVSVVALAISFLATIYPARAAARLDPVEALRYE